MAATRTLRTPLGRRVKTIEQGTGTPVVFLHSGVGSAGEWKQVFFLRPEGYQLVAIEAYRGGSGLGAAGQRSLDDYADQVYAVGEYVGAPICLVGFSWGGATALRVAAVAPEVVNSLTVIDPEAYALLRTQDPDAYAEICGLRDRWLAHVRAGHWYEAFEEFIDFYNGAGSFDRWAPERREAFLAVQKARGDLWEVLFDDALLTVDALAGVTAPVHRHRGLALHRRRPRDLCPRPAARPEPAAHVDRGRRPHDAAYSSRAPLRCPPRRDRAPRATDRRGSRWGAVWHRVMMSGVSGLYREDLAAVHALGFTDLVRAAAQDLICRLSGPCRIVEFGCGDGTPARQLCDAGHQLRGFDVSEANDQACQAARATSHVRGWLIRRRRDPTVLREHRGENDDPTAADTSAKLTANPASVSEKQDPFPDPATPGPRTKAARA